MLDRCIIKITSGKFAIRARAAQTGKLGGFQRDLGGATAVKSKGRGEKSDLGADLKGCKGRKNECCNVHVK